MSVLNYGYNKYFEKNINVKSGYKPARVLQKNSNFYTVVHDDGVETVQLTGRFKLNAQTLPVVGDFVFLEKSKSSDVFRIAELGNRKSVFSRKPAISGGRKIRNGQVIGGTTEEQVIASNIDIAFIVTDFQNDFNIMRLERYITAAKSQKIKPIVLLNKLDLVECPQEKILAVREIDSEIEVFPLSVYSNLGFDQLKKYLSKGETVAFLGSSGVGKSSIMNLLFGENRQMTKMVNQSSGKGKHTTTCSELFLHSSGCMLIDTPGIRELNLWCDEVDIESAYDDITSLIDACKFNDCNHDKEPGCAIKEALHDGTLSSSHYESYLKLMGEARHLKTRVTQKEIYQSRLKKRGKF